MVIIGKSSLNQWQEPYLNINAEDFDVQIDSIKYQSLPQQSRLEHIIDDIIVKLNNKEFFCSDNEKRRTAYLLQYKTSKRIIEDAFWWILMYTFQKHKIDENIRNTLLSRISSNYVSMNKQTKIEEHILTKYCITMSQVILMLFYLSFQSTNSGVIESEKFRSYIAQTISEWILGLDCRVSTIPWVQMLEQDSASEDLTESKKVTSKIRFNRKPAVMIPLNIVKRSHQRHRNHLQSLLENLESRGN